MKIKYLMFAILATSLCFAQKEEMKTLKKIHEKETPSLKDLADYKATIVAAEPLILSGTDSDKVYFEYYKASIPMVEVAIAMQKPENKANPANALKFFNSESISKLVTASEAVIAFEKNSGKQVYTKEIQEDFNTFKPMLLNYAVALGNDKKYSESAAVLYNIYLMDKKDQDKLYYSASYSVSANDYDAALKKYNELIALKYTGEYTVFWAKNLASGTEESFGTKAERDNFVRLKTHEKARDEKMPSKLPEIYKNIALIYVSQNKSADAIKALTDARASNPDDISLIMNEANLYMQLNDLVTYKKLITEVLQKNPNDADLLYNLGVISTKADQAEAEKYYLRAIEVDPKYLNAYLNLAIMKLEGEKAVITQMNKLGNTPADNKKYDVLKVQRQNIFKNAIPFLEKAVELDAKNYEAAKTLLNVYNALEIIDKAKPLKAIVKEMEANMKK